MSIKLRRLNDHAVSAIPNPNGEDKRPVKGAEIIALLKCIIFLCAKKNSGKTSAVFKLMKECAGRDTKIIVFCSTIESDPSWSVIRDYFESKNIVFVTFDALKEDGLDHLRDLLFDLKNAKLAEKEREENGDPPSTHIVDFGDSEDIAELNKKAKKPPKPTPYQAPEFLIVFDDLSGELKSKSVIEFLKVHRHYQMKVIISSQYLNDLKPEEIKQVDYLMLFRKQSEDKLKVIYDHVTPSVDFPTFMSLYKNATAKRYSFLFIDIHNDELRRGFSHVYDLDDLSDDEN